MCERCEGVNVRRCEGAKVRRCERCEKPSQWILRIGDCGLRIAEAGEPQTCVKMDGLGRVCGDGFGSEIFADCARLLAFCAAMKTKECLTQRRRDAEKTRRYQPQISQIERKEEDEGG
jgi:hypothetical protein